MDTNDSLLSEIQTLLRSKLFGVLATQGTEYPYCSLVGFAASEDARSLYFATLRETRKYKNLSDIPRVSLLIDDQANQASDLSRARALTVLGIALEVGQDVREDALALYLRKHPHLEEFVTASNCALVRIQVSNYILVSNFQRVREYTMQ